MSNNHGVTMTVVNMYCTEVAYTTSHKFDLGLLSGNTKKLSSFKAKNQPKLLRLIHFSIATFDSFNYTFQLKFKFQQASAYEPEKYYIPHCNFFNLYALTLVEHFVVLSV